MKIVKVSTSNPELSLMFLRQTSKEEGIWKDCRFIVNQQVERCDWWIICHSAALQQQETTICDPDHIVYISMEPTEQALPGEFFNQFSQLILCDRKVSHPHIRYANGLTWWVGMKVRHQNGHHFSPEFSLNYDILKGLSLPEKQNRISVVCSKNQSLPGHFKRLAFLEKLMAHPVGQYVDLFGGGHRAIPDKWDAIVPYKYHLVLENSVVPDYWSEKLGDAYLGFAFPIYYGCPNISKYFSKDSLQVIDIDDFDEAVVVLQNLLSQHKHLGYLPAITQARNKVLDDYNIFQLMADTCIEPAKSYKKCKLKPVSHFQRSWPRRLARTIIYRIRGIK